jgi:LysM repeat protein
METQSFRPCVIAFDQSSTDVRASLATRTTCVNVAVPKCKYCVQAGDTLHHVNKKFHLGASWLQLWNSNGMPEIEPDPLAPAAVVGDPDWIAGGSTVLNLGPLYRVQRGESLRGLAAVFRTTVRKLLDVNPDVAADPASLAEGAPLCVVPCTDAPFVLGPGPSAA